MLIRLALFAVLLVVLPLLGQLLAGNETSWVVSDANVRPLAPVFAAAGAVALLLLALEAGSRQSLFRLQRRYALALAGAGAASGWLLLTLNQHAESWYAPGTLDAAGILALTLLFALLPPAILGVRTLLARFPGLLQRLACLPAWPALDATQSSTLLVPLALLGLMGGAAWPDQLAWLLWSAPLWLLLTLQVLWHERTIFAEPAGGDWGRLLCAALAALLVCNLAMLAFRMAGGILFMHTSHAILTQLGYVLYGLFVLQLGDLVAEHWRGKPRGEVFKRKSFPIPVVTKKDP
jgi:hypothetical protein